MATITKNGITLSANSGSGDASITVSATANTKTTPRTARFTIVANTSLFLAVTVIQAGYSPYTGILQIGEL